MLMSSFAMMDLGPERGTLLERCRRVIARFFGFGDLPAELQDLLRSDPSFTRPATSAAITDLRVHMAPDVAGSAAGNQSLRGRRHPQLREQRTGALPSNERDARAQAVRALYAARSGDLDTAQHFFTLAASESSIDLCEIPGFWNLSRAAMLTAVVAYEENGRLRDASALGARIRTKLRPRALTSVPENVTELPARKLSLSSGS
jgi:hypothetical protein